MNATLMSNLSERFLPIPVTTFETLGWPSKAFEAVAFAILAYQTIHGEYGNVPSATGAKRPVVLGSVLPGHRPWKGVLA